MEKIPEFILAYHRAHPNSKSTPEETFKRYQIKLKIHFSRMRNDLSYRNRKTSVGMRWQRKRASDPSQIRYMLWQKAMRRAKRFDLIFTISPDDIILPEVCPVFGFKLRSYFGSKNEGRGASNTHYDSYSLDRIKPELGYVPGNIAVISHRANTLKRNATVEEIEALGCWMRRVTQ